MERSPWVGKHKGSLKWFGHVERIDKDSLVKKCREIIVEGHRWRGRPQKTWDEVTHGDHRVLNVQHEVAQDRVK